MKPTPLTCQKENVYEPFEDSFFLLDCLESEETYLNDRFKYPIIAEIGSGSGVITSFIPSVINGVQLASDISMAACESTLATWQRNFNSKKSKVDPVRGDLLNFLRPNTADIIVFNPPYVPSSELPSRFINDCEITESDDKWVDFALDGGVDGMEITNRALERLDAYLSPKGVAYILYIAPNRPETLESEMKKRGFDSKLINKRKAGRELLMVYRYSRC